MRNFHEVVDQAMLRAEVAGLRPMVEKEILHYAILHGLDREGLLDNLIFQGGTAIRMCYGGQRGSEDLDFCGGRGFAPAQLREIQSCMKSFIGAQYGIEIEVRNPKQMREVPSYLGLQIDRWQLSFITSPQQKHLPRQRIKFEVANIPAYDVELHALRKNHAEVGDGYEDTLIRVESMSEIMSDKVVALVASTEHIRHRDIWDLLWLKQRGAEPRPDLIRMKIDDYEIVDYQGKLDDRITDLHEVVRSRAFIDEMGRFLVPAVRTRTLDREGFLDYMSDQVAAIMDHTRRKLYKPEPEFEFQI